MLNLKSEKGLWLEIFIRFLKLYNLKTLEIKIITNDFPRDVSEWMYFYFDKFSHDNGVLDIFIAEKIIEHWLVISNYNNQELIEDYLVSIGAMYRFKVTWNKYKFGYNGIQNNFSITD